jgi:hypothetical protein
MAIRILLALRASHVPRMETRGNRDADLGTAPRFVNAADENKTVLIARSLLRRMNSPGGARREEANFP